MVDDTDDTDEVRQRLALALDVDDLDEARRMAGALAPWIGVAKVGLELYGAAGPAAVTALRVDGFRVFLDAKLHDIPTTVGRAARVLGRLGIGYLNLHAAGGHAMLAAGVEGMAVGAAEAGVAGPIPIAVTVLTSDPDTSAFESRLQIAIDAGCRGVVCSAHELARVLLVRKERAAAGFVTIVPGVRLEGTDTDDQARVGTPARVAAAGADLLVVGRTVTAAADPEDAARRLHDEVAAALAPRSRV
ncbi:MAG: orotidine-5-phosphate decarboxylase [Actinomycetota bacterium]|jgi:orotidine-5'-phosphate decarboxylase|nr:orotidine-5-phosphate decarboxylase [Actinomycetota bacterium]